MKLTRAHVQAFRTFNNAILNARREYHQQPTSACMSDDCPNPASQVDGYCRSCQRVLNRMARSAS